MYGPSLAWQWRTPQLLMAAHVARNLCDNTVTKDVAPILLCFVNEGVLMWVSHGIQLKYPLQK